MLASDVLHAANEHVSRAHQRCRFMQTTNARYIKLRVGKAAEKDESASLSAHVAADPCGLLIHFGLTDEGP